MEPIKPHRDEWVETTSGRVVTEEEYQQYLKDGGIEWRVTPFLASLLGAVEAILISAFGRNAAVTWVFYEWLRTLASRPAKPPQVGWLILGLVCPAALFEAVSGDIEELFFAAVTEHGRLAAQSGFWWQIMMATTRFAVQAFLRKSGIGSLVQRLTR